MAKDSYNMFKLKVIHLADLGHIIAVLFLNAAMIGECAKFSIVGPAYDQIIVYRKTIKDKNIEHTKAWNKVRFGIP